MTSHTLPFALLAPGIGVGNPAPAGWRPIAELPLLILVGLTGVGKTTVVGTLRAGGQPLTELPDRRALTDRLLIAQVQAAAGEPIRPITDRLERFAYTRRYRELFPGGMAAALSTLWLNSERPDVIWLFDGLRGANEVSCGAAALPLASFIALHAPDLVRVQRLLGRGDTFDQVAGTTSAGTVGAAVGSFSDLGIPEAQDVFSQEAEALLVALTQTGQVSVAELAAKVKIVVEERRNYDPESTLAALQQVAADRTLAVDTTRHSAVETAALIQARFGAQP